MSRAMPAASTAKYWVRSSRNQSRMRPVRHVTGGPRLRMGKSKSASRMKCVATSMNMAVTTPMPRKSRTRPNRLPRGSRLTRLASQKMGTVRTAHRYDSANASAIGVDDGSSAGPRGSRSRLAAVRTARTVQNAKMSSSSVRWSGNPPRWLSLVAYESGSGRFAVGAVVGAVAAGGLWMYRNAEASEGPAYRFATVTRGNLESTVSATGALSAVTTVQVGTQVSGLVRQIYVDFNDRVKKGQLLARIDPTLQQQAVLDAQAGLVRAQADLERSKAEYDRNKTLFDAKVLTASEFNTAQYNYTVAQAGVKSAQVALERARKNLSYTEIYAPIDGVVVER